MNEPVYLTVRGRDAMERERQRLLREERPKVVEVVSWAASNGDRSENGDYLYGKKRLREIDKRVRFLGKRLEAATVVDPMSVPNRAQVFFGAWVRIADEDGTETVIQLVGVDEADVAQGRVNWRSPMGRALMKTRAGDVVTVHTPAGPREIEILAIAYEEPGEPSNEPG